MNQEEWLSSADSQMMLQYLFTHPRYSERKMRLFAVACYWQVSEFHWDEPLFESEINAIERYADGLIGKDELLEISLARGRQEFPGEDESALRLVTLEADYAAWIADWAVQRTLYAGEQSWDIGAADAKQAELLRDIFNNPFHETSFDTSCRSGEIASVSKSIYDELSFDRMPELGDLLEREACSNSDLIEHCRSTGDHVRGCWALDLVLGKS